MDDAERRVAVLDRIDEDAHRPDVVERVDADLLAPQLAEDAVDVLRPAAHVGGEPRGRELALQRRDHVADVALAIEPSLVDEPGDPLVFVGLERAQRQVLELPLELPDAEAVGERRVDVHHLARGDAAAATFASHQMAQRLRPLGKLDQHHADVLDHREEHLAQVLGLRGALLPVGANGERLHGIHPRDALDEGRDVGAERRHDAIAPVAGSLGQPDQQRGRQRVRIESLRGEDAGGAERAGDQRLAIGAAQVAQRLAREFVRGRETLAVGVRVDR